MAHVLAEIVLTNFFGEHKFYHFPIGHLAFANIDLAAIKHPHFLQVCVLGLKKSQPLQISNLASATSSGDLGEPLNKSQGFTSGTFVSSLIYPIIAHTEISFQYLTLVEYITLMLSRGGLYSIFGLIRIPRTFEI